MSVDVAEIERKDLRCPAALPGRDGDCHPGKLLARVLVSGDQPSFVKPDNLIELSCTDCCSRLRRRGRAVIRVLHRFDLAGELVETLVQESQGAALSGGASASTTGMPAWYLLLPIVPAWLAWAWDRWLRTCCRTDPGEEGEVAICRHSRAMQYRRGRWVKISRRAWLRAAAGDMDAELHALTDGKDQA